MFLSEVTVVDHAYIDNHGRVIGGSFLPSFKVAGEIDPVEKVVVDFSTVKKDLKRHIDHPEYGFDHKLWVIWGWSKCSIDRNEKEGTVTIGTPCMTLSLPENAVREITYMDDSHSLRAHNVDNAGSWFQRFLQSHMEQQYPSIKIECNNSIRPVLPLPTKYSSLFSYVHGLKESTSWGCQNIAHGHLSFLQAVSKDGQEIAPKIIDQVATELDNTIFVWAQNLDEGQEKLPRGRILTKADAENGIHGDSVVLSYTTERGRFSMVLDMDEDLNKIVILDTETTIEYLVEYAAGRLAAILDKPESHFEIYVSEGLSKGAFTER